MDTPSATNLFNPFLSAAHLYTETSKSSLRVNTIRVKFTFPCRSLSRLILRGFKPRRVVNREELLGRVIRCSGSHDALANEGYRNVSSPTWWWIWVTGRKLGSRMVSIFERYPKRREVRSEDTKTFRLNLTRARRASVRGFMQRV